MTTDYDVRFTKENKKKENSRCFIWDTIVLFFRHPRDSFHRLILNWDVGGNCSHRQSTDLTNV